MSATLPSSATLPQRREKVVIIYYRIRALGKPGRFLKRRVVWNLD